MSEAFAVGGVALTIFGIVLGAGKFRPGLSSQTRDHVDLVAYLCRGVGSAMALYSLLELNKTAWGFSIGGLLLGGLALWWFWRHTAPRDDTHRDERDGRDENGQSQHALKVPGDSARRKS